MNRSLTNVLFGGISSTTTQENHKIEGTITKTSVEDTVEALANADSVMLVVGYGMAVAKAQYAIAEITAMLRSKGVNVKVRSRFTPGPVIQVQQTLITSLQFAIHPVAGRMPGQCNVLLAEASVPYDSTKCSFLKFFPY